jgi:hypothetical protein
MDGGHIMVAVGDKLGGRYFITKAEAKLSPGEFLEVRDAQANVFYAQVLGTKPMSQPEVTALAREVASVSPMPTLFLPDEVTQDPTGVPFAIFSRAPAAPLLDDLRMYESGGSKERRALTFRALTTAFGLLAEELGRAGGSRSVHGAIAANHVGATGRDDTLKLELRGFGIDAAARLQARQERPAPRVDAAAIFLTLHDLLHKTGSLPPEGAALVKWNLLLACARAGDHPALQTTTALSRFLRDVLADAEKVREAPTARHATAPAEASSPPPAASPVPPPPRRFDPRAWFDDHRRAAIGGAIGIGVLALAGVAASMMDDAPAVTTPPPAVPAAARDGGAEALPACVGESLPAPASAELAPDGDLFESVCAGASLRLFSSSGANLMHAAREARRGARFGDAVTLVTGGRTGGADALGVGAASWVAWRQGQRFSVGRVGDDATPVIASAEVPGSWRDAWLLSVTERQAWVASTLDRPDGSLVVAIRLPIDQGGDTLRVYALGPGTIEAVIPGETASLLVRRTQGRSHEFTCITATTAVLPVLAQHDAPDAGDASPMGTIPEVSLQRTPVFTAEGERVAAAPVGVGRVGAPRTFLLTEGAEGVGAVTLLTYPPQGSPVAQVLVRRGSGVGLGANGRGEPVAVVGEGPATLLFTRGDAEAPVRERIPLRGVLQAQVVTCGGEPWLAYASATPARVAALPLVCLSRRALAR